MSGRKGDHTHGGVCLGAVLPVPDYLAHDLMDEGGGSRGHNTNDSRNNRPDSRPATRREELPVSPRDNCTRLRTRDLSREKDASTHEPSRT